MSRYIDADKLQQAYKEIHDGKRSLLIDTEPTADVWKNVKGEWIKLDEEPVYIIECSKCGDKQLNMIGQPLPKFCSNCGAEMKGERYDMR